MPENAFLARLFHDMQEWIARAGFGWEADWQRTRSLETLTESEFLRETAWVILCSGFRAAVVRQRFDHISLCFCDWESAEVISRRRELCVTTAVGVFRHESKMRAIADVAALVAQEGFPRVHERLRSDALPTLQELPYIGPVTSTHLAKNLGIPTSKPDRHLVRLAQRLSCSSPFELCESVSSVTGEPVAVVDVVFWRFMEQGGPLNLLSAGAVADTRLPQ